MYRKLLYICNIIAYFCFAYKGLKISESPKTEFNYMENDTKTLFTLLSEGPFNY